MKRLFLFLLIISFFSASGKGGDTLRLTKDFLTNDSANIHNLDGQWLFHIGDSLSMAEVRYDDRHWSSITTNIRYRLYTRVTTDTFSSIGWFRMHFIADSSIIGLPLALMLTHYGASEVYLDGKEIGGYGRVSSKDSCVYYDPQYLPLTFAVFTPGSHVLAIRYANYNARHQFENYKRSFSGFKVLLSEATIGVMLTYRLMGWVFTCAILFGVLLAFGIAHIFIFLYHRSAVANVYFSIFCLCLSCIFLFFVLNRISNDPGTITATTIGTAIVASLGCFSFSGLTNSLFSTKKLRFGIVTGISAACLVFWKLNTFLGGLIYVLLASFVFFEAAIITIRAIYKKTKGARIIGTGILFFTLFFFASIIFFTLHGDIQDNTVGGKIYLVTAACAIFSIPIFMSLYLAWDYAFVNRGLKDQLQQVEKLSELTLRQEQEKKHMLEGQNEMLEKEVASRTAEVLVQKKKSDDLLLNILPAEVAEELKEKGSSEARYFDHVTVLFTDFVNFTRAGEQMTPQELVNELHTCFKAFDDIVSRHGIEKIKTIGDAYLAVCGLPEQAEDHAIQISNAAIEIIGFMAARKQQMGDKTFDVRIGLHSGSVVAGIVGVKKFAYDIWGDTVNTAARMEQHSEPGKINISEMTYDLVKDQFECTYRGKIEAKNKGELSMYFIDKKRP